MLSSLGFSESGTETQTEDPFVVAATGHRPEKIGGYDFDAPKRVWIRARMREALLVLEPQYGISGMALGIDQDFAFCCVELGIPFVAAVPFIGQESTWPRESREYYHELLSHAYCRYVVTGGGYSAYKMEVRNQWMVDNCDVLLAIWDGTSGGTGNCCEYAELVKRQTYRLSPRHYGVV